jgi:prepilin-type N-terminal cleavage/methylation domain-containing protein
MNIIKHKGFTLIEMAIVLVIIGLLLAGLMIPFTEQVRQKNRSETTELLRESKQALVGYTLANEHLPCPDKTGGATTGPNDRPNDGVEDFNALGVCITPQGNLPWATLDLVAQDAWGTPLLYRVVAAYSDRPPQPTTFGLGTPSSIVICNEAACATPTLTSTAVAVIISRGANRGICTTTPSPPNCIDETENNDIDANFVSHPDTATGSVSGEFDDQVIWLSRSVLLSNMVSAGLLP